MITALIYAQMKRRWVAILTMNEVKQYRRGLLPDGAWMWCTFSIVDDSHTVICANKTDGGIFLMERRLALWESR